MTTDGGRLLLFDIDGTLLNSRGAGQRAFHRALKQVLGNGIPTVQVDYAGRTDRFILRETLQRLGHAEPHPVELTREIFSVYLEFLEDELQRVPRGSVCPGIPAVLDRLVGRSGVHLGLLTGNHREGARLKLRHFALESYFPFGAFGDQSLERRDLVGLAARDAERIWPHPWTARHCWLIGDTPRDIQAARSAGARSAAVATGPYSFDELKAESPNLVFHDLTDPSVVPLLAAEGPNG